MSQERRAKSCVLVIVVWCVIIGAVAVSYRFLIAPYFAERLELSTGSESQYDYSIRLALDSFSGYALLRSPVLADELKDRRIQLEVVDDGADYSERLKSLHSGENQLAVFTIDSLLQAGARLGDFPCSIVLVLDETQGADAIVAYKQGVSSIQDLDAPDARFVLTPSSPSEFLARVVLADFNLPSLPNDWAEPVDGAEIVYKRFRSANKTERRAYVLWEPFVTEALGEEGAHVLLDSSNLKGYIVDVLVAERRFLRERPELVAAFVEAYLRTAYSYRARDGGMVDLVMADARQSGGHKLNQAQAQKLVQGIQWKSTLDNFVHFGLVPEDQTSAAAHLEDMIDNITRVLVQTDAVASDPLRGRVNTVYYDRILRDLQAQGFHPARKAGIVQGVNTGPDAVERVEQAVELPALSDRQWDALVQVGELRVKPIAFGRGTARINIQSQRELEALAKRLLLLPQYYVKVVGNARAEGDPEANRRLAQERADAAAAVLRDQRVHANRIRSVTAEPSDAKAAAQSVTFIVGQPSY
jgi:outer membrane protein OmpA-like peptidoglycan-associated protein